VLGSAVWRRSVLFRRGPSKRENARREVRSSLVELMLEADEVGRERLLSLALRTGELCPEEAAELVGMVRQLESIGLLGRAPAQPPPVPRFQYSSRTSARATERRSSGTPRMLPYKHRPASTPTEPLEAPVPYLIILFGSQVIIPGNAMKRSSASAMSRM